MKRLLRWGVYLLAFAVGRGALFLAPLVLANTLEPARYGAIEWAYAAATTLTTVLGLGTAAVVPLVVISKTTTATMAGIGLHHLGVVVACAVGMAGGHWLGVSEAAVLTFLFLAVIPLQQLASVEVRSKRGGDLSVLVDALLFGSMAIASLVARRFNPGGTARWVAAAAGAYGVVLLVWRLHATVATRKQGDRWNYVEAVRAGVPLMLTSMSATLATTSGRLGIGVLGGALFTAEYSALARAAALPIIGHQVLLVAGYQDLFRLDPGKLERRLLQIVGAVAAFVMFFWVASLKFSWVLGGAFGRAFEAHHVAGLWILAQSILWSGIALNELVISRHQVGWPVLRVTLPVLLLALGAVFFLLNAIGLSLERYVYGHAAVMTTYFVAQAVAMWSSGVRLTRVWSGALLAYAFVLLAIYWTR